MNRSLQLATLFAFLFTGCNTPQSSTDDGKSVTIKLVHTPEMQSYVQSVLEEFYALKPSLAGGVAIQVVSEALGGFDAAKDIARGFVKADVWLSPSTSLVGYANSMRKNLGAKQSDCKQLFASPMVFATQKQNLPLLQTEGQEFSFRYFFERLSDPVDQGEDGSTPKLPPVTISHGALQGSDTGLPALMQLAYLASQTEQTITPDEIRLPQNLDRLRRFESYSSMYSPREWLMLSRTASASRRALHLALTTEQRLASFNAYLDESRGSLVALYPTEGSYWQDYSICTSDADWVTAAHRAAIKVFVDFLSGEFAQLAAKKKGYRTSILPLYEVEPLKKEFGVDLSLPKKSLLPGSAEVTTAILEAWPKIMRPHAVLFVLDSSGSMEGGALRVAKEQIRNLMATMLDSDMKGLMQFSSEATLVTDFTMDTSSTIASLDPIRAIGGSALHDSIVRGVDELSRTGLEQYRKTLVLVTDGDDKNSKVSLDKIIERLNIQLSVNDITLVLVGINSGETDFSDLAKIAKSTNGIFRESSLDGMQGVFSEVRNLF